MNRTSPRCTVVPPYLLMHLAALEDLDLAEPARRTLAVDTVIRSGRGTRPSPVPTPEPAPNRTISDAQGRAELPGVVVRREGESAIGDPAADEAYDGLGATFALFLDGFGRNSLDGAGQPLDATVHYSENYDNAFWDGERMVFGDGDGRVFDRFTRPLSIVGHELTHGVTQFTANLTYEGQPGALNESISDVFGVLVEQFARRQNAEEASWLVGEGLFLPGINGRGLRSLAEPGTAYDDPVLGKDPQPGHMRDYIETDEDNGGVHLNSGIPNKAFARAAVTLRGSAWERAGQVWYDAITDPTLTAESDFATFAALTSRLAAQRYGAGSEDELAVRGGWAEVGLEV